MATFPEDPKADLTLKAKGIIDLQNGKVWEDSYLLNQTSREGRANFDKDPVIAKFQATARKGCLKANSTLRKRAGVIKRQRSKNKIVVNEDELLQAKINEILPQVEAEMKKNKRRSNPEKLERQMNELYEEKEKVEIKDPGQKAIYELLLKLNKRMDNIEQKMNQDMQSGKIQPLVTTNKVSKNISKEWSNQLENAVEEFKSRQLIYAYVDFFESVVKAGYEVKNFTEGKQLYLVGAFKNVLYLWMKTTLVSLREGLYALLKASYKVAGVMWPGNWGNLPQVIISMGAELVQLGLAFSWLWINVQAVTAVAAISDLLFGTNYATYMAVVAQELFNYLLSFIADALLLPVRAVMYILTNGDWDDLSVDGVQQGLSNAGAKNARLWYCLRYFLDSIGGQVGAFLETLKNSSNTLKNLIEIGGTLLKIISWLFKTLGTIAAKGIDITRFVVTDPVNAAKATATAAKEGVKVGLEHGAKVLKAGSKILKGGTVKLLEGAKAVLDPVANWLNNVEGRYLTAGGPAQYYDVLFVCAVLNTSMADLKQMKNQYVVSFAFNKPNMTLGEVFLVVQELKKEKEQKEVLLLEDKPKLKF